MSTFQRSLIETKIQGMEGGRFQELLLCFLPLYDETYTDMIRNGHTEWGKTKPGVPDLLKTFPNGQQIGCEGGTDEDYWHPPKEIKNYTNWKPIQDIQKALKALAKPVEIVAASSRPIPANYPNVKTTIIDYFESSGCLITLFTSADIASWVEKNLSKKPVFNLAKEFFIEAVENEILTEKNDQLVSALNLGEQLGFPTNDIFNVLKSGDYGDSDLAQQAVVEQIFGDSKRYVLEIGLPFKGVHRCKKHVPELLEPFGKVFQLLGAPKIGKTNICLEAITIGNYEHIFFSAPADEHESKDFIDMLLININSRLMSVADAVTKVKGWKKRQQQSSSPTNNITPYFIVIDNAHLISNTQLKRLEVEIRDLKSKKNLENICLVLVTNKNLQPLLSIVNSTLVAQAWTAIELQELIESRGINISDPDISEYCTHLAVQSGGHPLFAIALVSTCKDRSALVLNKFHRPEITDSELSAEIKAVLYQDILTTPDQQNLIQRLCIFNGKVESDVLEAIRLKVQPQIQTSISNLVESIGPAVLDGSEQTGLKVSPTFKEVANEKISLQEKKVVYSVAAKTLLSLNGKTIMADRWIDGIFYYAMADKIGRASASALFLLAVMARDGVDNKQYLKDVLDRLFYFKLFKAEQAEGLDYLNLVSLRSLMSFHYASLGENKEAVSYLEIIDLSKLMAIKVPKEEMNQLKAHAYASTVTSRVFLLNEMKNPSQTVFDYLDWLKDSEDQSALKINEMLPDLIIRLSPEKLTEFNFEEFSNRYYKSNLADLVKIATTIGFKSKKHQSLKDAILNLKDLTPAAKLFKDLATSSLLSAENQHQKAIELVNSTERDIEHSGISKDNLGAIFYQHKGDTLYALDMFPDAITAFEKSTSLESNNVNFVVAWNKFKIGLASSKYNEIVENLTDAAEKFVATKDYNHAGRSLGALAAYYLEQKQYKKAFEIVFKLADWHHKDQIPEVGTALRLIGVNMLRVKHDLIGTELPDPIENFPVPTRNHYSTIDGSVRPQTGGVITYQVMAQLAKTVNERDFEIQALKQALYSPVLVALDRQSLMLNWIGLFEVLEPNEINEFEFAIFIKKVLQFQPAPGGHMEKFFMQGFFTPFEQKLKLKPKEWSPIVLKLLEITREVLSTVDESLSKRWNCRLTYVNGLVLEAMGDVHGAYSKYIVAAKEALRDTVYEVGISASFQRSFSAWKAHPSILEAGSANYEMFKFIELQGTTQESIDNLGVNLFRFWSTRKLTQPKTSDVPVVESLLFGAAILKSENFTEDEAAPIMVSLLLKCFNHGDSCESFLDCPKAPPYEIVKKLI